MDMSFMSKFAVSGCDAGRCLNRLCTADVAGPAVPDGTITYCQLLNGAGTVEADVTVRVPPLPLPLPLPAPSLTPPPPPHR